MLVQGLPEEVPARLLGSGFVASQRKWSPTKMGVSTSTVNTYLDRVRIEYANAGRPAATKAALLAGAIQDGLIGLDEQL